MLFLEKPFWEGSKGAKIGSETINTVRFADGTVILTETLDDLHTLIDSVYRVSMEMGLTKVDETKVDCLKGPVNNWQVTL